MLMSYKTIELHNEKLLLVISTNLSEVTAIMRGKFKILFFHLSLIILIICLSGYTFFRINAKRIRAEEEHRHFQNREELQRQIDHSAKLASIGELVDTIAHEINTPSGIISIQTEALKLDIPKDEKYLNRLKIIKKQTTKIHGYTRRLLDFSQRMPFQPTDVNLVSIIDDCIYLIDYRLSNHNITIIKNYSKNLAPINIDRDQIEQVVFNLLNNSIDAIKNNGEIKLAIEQVRRNNKNGVKITISDNGSGISKVNMPFIFEPFFTTKQDSHGTGLGLYITKSIIQRHKGDIQATSETGKGTTFKIYLPKDNSVGK